MPVHDDEKDCAEDGEQDLEPPASEGGDADGEGDGRGDGAERDVMCQQGDYREDYPAYKAHDGVDREDDDAAAEDALAALEPVVDGEDVSERQEERPTGY